MTRLNSPQMPGASPVADRGAAAQMATFLDLIKFAHSIFALPFALMATVWAFRVAGIRLLTGAGGLRVAFIVACMVIARTFAMTFNRLVDRGFDAANPRTARRPSVTGAVSVRFMKGTLWLCAALFLAVTGGWWWWTGNFWPFALALPVLAWLGSYSLTKRFTALCHFWLGASLGLAPISAWLAIVPASGISPLDQRGLAILLLGAGVMFWVAGFDILYAMQDEAFDRAANLRSLPAALAGGALTVSRLCHGMTAALFLAVGIAGGFQWIYWIGYAAAVVLLAVEQSLVSPKDISRINLAFMTANGLIGLLFGALAIVDMLVH